ncbi:MAG: putative transcriptional regulator [Fusobacteria bacterium]|nr:MAG: putative transcriptional regulator [Fusobacteriota bacterium]KAF0228636.1 MAG: putative transcriptional [Fusobacteriota bacterium]
MAKFVISNNIRKLRFYNEEMTQQELAKRTGVTRQTIVAIENSKYSPTLELAFRIAEVFRTKVEDIFTYEIIEEKNKKEEDLK